jgi:hypothetical protein
VKKELTQAEIADLMLPALIALPLTDQWTEIVVIVRRVNEETELHSVVLQPAFEDVPAPSGNGTTVLHLPAIPPGYALRMLGELLTIEPCEPEQATKESVN